MVISVLAYILVLTLSPLADAPVFVRRPRPLESLLDKYIRMVEGGDLDRPARVVSGEYVRGRIRCPRGEHGGIEFLRPPWQSALHEIAVGDIIPAGPRDAL